VRRLAEPTNKCKTMKKFTLLIILITSSNTLFGQATYSDNETKEIIQMMVDAHGGVDAWNNVEAIRFTKKATPRMQNGELTPNPWITEETVHLKTERVIIKIKDDGGLIVKNGEEIWDLNVSEQKKKVVTPAMLSLMTFKFTNMPWLTQQRGVVLEEAKLEKLPNENKLYYSIKMTFGDEFGYAIGDFYRLFIDPDSYQLKAISFSINMSKFVPGGPQTPEMVHVFNKYSNVSGLLFPTRYYTYPLTLAKVEGNHSYGAVHEVWDWELLSNFDEARMKKPEGASAVKDEFKKGAAK